MSNPYRLQLNVNDMVRVRLTDSGRALLKRQHDELSYHVEQRGGRPLVYVPPVEDEHGWSRWQMWDLFYRLGAHLVTGAMLPFGAIIELELNIPDPVPKVRALAEECAKTGGGDGYRYLQDLADELIMLRAASDPDEAERMRNRLRALEQKVEAITRLVRA